MNTTPFHDSTAPPPFSESSGIMLFGVRLTQGSPSSQSPPLSSSSSAFRKSVSMNNLSMLDPNQDTVADVAAGYASDDFVHASGRGRERKRGTPWTAEEHRLFLIGLQQVGKGDWRGISKNFVKTRTPTQVASHAQKYYQRVNNQNPRRRRRTSLFDITSDTVVSSNMEEDDQVMHGAQFKQSMSMVGRLPTCPLPAAPVSISQAKTLMELEATPLTLGQPANGHSHANIRRHHQTKINSSHVRSMIPPSSKLASLKLNPSSVVDPLPLSLRLPSGSANNSLASSSSSTFQGAPQDSLSSSGDSMISVA